MVDLTNEIRAYALKNALEYGKAEQGSILPKLFNHGLEKTVIKQIMPLIAKEVARVNKLTTEQRAQEFALVKTYVKEHEEHEKTLPELPGAVDGKVVVRLPPEPSKYLHVGHALSFILNALYAERYHGKVLLRLEDCNPEKVSEEYCASIIEDITEYLAIPLASVSYVSDDMSTLLAYGKQLVEQGQAYICFCSQDVMRDNRHAGIACSCRNKPIAEQKKNWVAFVVGKYEEGEAVVRHRGDMQASNHVMRDSVLWRVIHKKHFRQGSTYSVWPMYDFYNAIEDSISGVTHVLRSVEFSQRAPLHQALREALGLRHPVAVEYGRFGVTEKTTKGREIRELVKSGEYIGWDDPRLVTLKALRRRGITKEVLYELAQQVGMKKSEVWFEFPMIASVSRKLIDETTERYTFIPEPVAYSVQDAPIITRAELPLHPHRPERTRPIKVTPGKMYLSAEDKKAYAGKEVRLVHLYNLQLPKRGMNASYTDSEQKPLPKLTWLSEAHVSCRVFMDDGTWREGIAEENIAGLTVGRVIQFERFGFCKLDKVVKQGARKTYEFWFTHA